MPVLISSMSLGSRSTDTGLGTCTCLTEEVVEGANSPPNGLVTWHLTIGLDAMFQATELPAAIADLDTSLAKAEGHTLTHGHCFVAGQWMAESRRGCSFLQRDARLMDVREPLGDYF